MAKRAGDRALISPRYVRQMADDVLRCGDLVVDRAAHEAFVDDVPLGLSHLQFVLLSYLVAHADRVVTRDELRGAVAAITSPTDRTITSTLSRVRTRLGAGPRRPVISAARSRGYQLTVPVAAPGKWPRANSRTCESADILRKHSSATVTPDPGGRRRPRGVRP